jgi:hypothetical protein
MLQTHWLLDLSNIQNWFYVSLSSHKGILVQSHFFYKKMKLSTICKKKYLMSCEAITSQNLTKKIEGQIKDSGQHKRNYFYCKKNYFITKTLCLSKEINNKLLLSFSIFLFQHCHHVLVVERLYLHNYPRIQSYSSFLLLSTNLSTNNEIK